jgi:hypothetical protein
LRRRDSVSAIIESDSFKMPHQICGDSGIETTECIPLARRTAPATINSQTSNRLRAERNTINNEINRCAHDPAAHSIIPYRYSSKVVVLLQLYVNIFCIIASCVYEFIQPFIINMTLSERM